jgi:DNA-binding IclR family transcriptional regulator
VGNALRLLLLLRKRKELRVTECATELGVARSTAHRMLVMLEHYGFLQRAPGGRSYRSGEALLALGLSAVNNLDIRARARPFMESLRDRVDETIALVLLEGRNVRFVDAVETTRALRVGGQVGLLLPAHATSAGKAILAAMAPSALRELYPDDALPGRAGAPLATRTQLEEDLAEVRRTGYAVAYNESDVDIGAVGVTIPDGPHHGRAALAIAAPASRLTPQLTQTWAQAARETAQRIGAG